MPTFTTLRVEATLLEMEPPKPVLVLALPMASVVVPVVAEVVTSPPVVLVALARDASEITEPPPLMSSVPPLSTETGDVAGMAP